MEAHLQADVTLRITICDRMINIALQSIEFGEVNFHTWKSISVALGLKKTKKTNTKRLLKYNVPLFTAA